MDKLQTNVLREPRFVGREQVLSQLDNFLDRAIQGKGVTVFISGEAGSGKTRLSREFLNAAKCRGVAVLDGWCLSNVAVPYFPFLEAFNSFESAQNEENNVRSTQRQQMKAKIFGSSDALEQNQALNPQVWKDQTYATITEELLHISTNRPTILFIDDIHWADSASLALMHYIARSAHSERLLILATFRSEESTIINGQTNPLADTLRLMGREDLFKEIKLPNLNQVNVAEIAESMLNAPLNAKFAEKLAEESAGNPLFIVESLRMMHSQGNLKLQHGKWHLAHAEMIIPDKVKDVILRRLNNIKTDQRRILDIASLIGEKFDPKLVASALQEKNIIILEALNHLATSTLLVYNEGQYYRFKHAKIQEMLSKEIPLILKEEYHLKIAESLENSNTLAFSDIAYHYANAGKTQKAIKYSLAAGKDALARWSNVEAIKHFSYVLQVSGSIVNTAGRETALEGLGDAYYANCMFEDAIQAYDKLSTCQNPTIKIRALRKEMDAIWFKERDSTRLVDLVKKAEPIASVDRLESARVCWNKGRIYVWKGQEQLKLGSKYHEEALCVFEEEYSLPDIASILWPVGLVRIWLGMQESKGLAQMLRGIALLHELDDSRGEILAYRMGLTDWFTHCGLLKESYDSLKDIREIGEKIGDYDNLAFAWLRLSNVPTLERDFSQAIDYCLKALENCKKADTVGTLCLVYAKLTQLYVLQTNLEKARQYLNALREIPKETREHPLNSYYVACAESFFLAGSNHIEQAQEILTSCKDILSQTYPYSVGVDYWIKSDYSLFLDLIGNRQDAKTLMEQANNLIEKSVKKFERTKVIASFMAYRKPPINQPFEIRLDIVNVSRNKVSITKIENLINPQIEVINCTPNCLITPKNVELKEREISPFQVTTLKMNVKALKPGSLTLHPTIFYTEKTKKSRSCKANPITIFPQQVLPTENQDILEVKLKLASEPSKKAFSYLIKAFQEDSYSKKLPKEQAGWRTLMQIVKGGYVTKHSMYGQQGHGGQTIGELKKLGLIDIRYFTRERGRGGNVLKLKALTPDTP